MAGLENKTSPSDSHKDWTTVVAEVIEFTCVYYGFFLVVMGCVCNSLSFIVLSRKAFRSTKFSLYPRILSASDLGNLLTMFFSFLLQKAFDIDIASNVVACQVILFSAQLFLLISSWTLVIMTVERVLSIYRPLRHRILCSGAVTKVVIAATFVILSLISLLPALTYEDTVVIDTVTNTTTAIRCERSIKESSANLGLYLAMLIIVLFAVLPGLLLVIFNIFIIVGVVRSRKTLMRKAIVTAGLNVDTSRPISTVTPIQRNTFRSSGPNRISRQETSLTRTVLAINITFIMCIFPACAFGASIPYLTDDMALIGPLNDLLILLLYTNNAMNFVLYYVTGTKFRSEVKAFFRDIIHCRCSA